MKVEVYIGRGDGLNCDGPFTVAQIDAKIRQDESVSEKLFRKSFDPGFGEQFEKIRYEFLPRFTVEFEPDIDTFIVSRYERPTTVFSGPNNSGKSLILKQMLSTLGHRACLLTCNRYSSIDVINTQSSHGFDERRQHYDSAVSQLDLGHFHDDQNPRQLEQLIRGLTDVQQDQLFGLAGQLLGAKIRMLQTDASRTRTSPWYVDINGQSLKYASSGTRLLFTLLAHLFDEYFEIAMIDEPELGLSPKIQATLARALYDDDVRKQYFPHIKQVFIVTHSHLFLDRKLLSNNFIVEKSGDVVTTRPVRSIADFHELQFGMLGNDLDHLYMPAAVVIVEGACDVSYLTRIFALHIPNRRVAIVVANGDGRAAEKVRTLSEGWGDLCTSPYRSRLFVVLDAKFDMKKSSITRQGVLDANVHVWSRNGIEWYYPKRHVAAAFKCSEGELSELDLGAERITINSISLSKMDLAGFVVPRMTIDDNLDPELTAFLDKVKLATA